MTGASRPTLGPGEAAPANSGLGKVQSIHGRGTPRPKVAFCGAMPKDGTVECNRAAGHRSKFHRNGKQTW